VRRVGAGDEMNGIAISKPLSMEKPHPVVGKAILRASDLWWATLAATLIPVSLIWDFSWESSIGVDRFWSPPHLATYVGVALSGILGARLLVAFTFARRTGRAAGGVNVGPLSGPSGAWILLWGAALVQATLPLDNWWQQAYGLGAGLWPPPQLLKTVGFFAILLGGALLCAAQANNSEAARPARRLLTWHGGLLLTLTAVVLIMIVYPNRQHTGLFYLISCALYPVVLVGAGGAAQGRWASTRIALAYMAVSCAMVWLLPLFPARPLTPPIHNPLDRLMSPPFPLLLVAPALLLDWLRPRNPGSAAIVPASLTTRSTDKCRQDASAPRTLIQACAAGLGFFALFIAVQWTFAEFMLSSGSDNWVFAGGGRHWPFFLKIDQARVMFWGMKEDPLTWQKSLLAITLAILSAWSGLRVATWLSKLRR
jgi:hypothetical protein